MGRGGGEKKGGSYGLASCQLKSTTKGDRMRLGKVKKGRKGVVAGHSFVNRAVPSNGLIGNRPSLLLSPPSLLSSLEKKPSSLNSREQGILGEMKIESNNQASLARSDSSSRR